MARKLQDGTEFEIINLPSSPEKGYYMNVQLAINGTPCWPFNVPASSLSGKTQDEKISILVRHAQVMVETYGDVRRPKEYIESMGKSLRELCAA